MGSWPRSNLRFSGRVSVSVGLCLQLGLCLGLQLGLGVGAAVAQAQPDAGVTLGTNAANSVHAPELPRRGLVTGADRSAQFPRVDPSQLSEGVRAQLQQRALARQPSSGAAAEPSPSTLPAPTRALTRRVPSEEFSALGDDRKRRVRSFETDEGITVLSNRLPPDLPHARLSLAMQASRAAPERESEALVDPPRVTETHSLRAYDAKLAKPKSESPDTSQGWLLWPILLFATSAIVGTLWFRKKTQ